ncbi:HMA1 [Symbiodinium pilosum]|uniref:HMA1 protein n=1 Tax=Symbiodinium pilosum TaxID=2952 RepID=A0A812WKT7_SYMPI|nr:HMA1 [Symbiodinium pilosum]
MESDAMDNVGVASTLVGAMVFLMCLTYLTNHSDKDIRRYSYEVISQTIAIFCAVMIFQYMNDVTVKVVQMFGLQRFHFLVQMCQMLVWYAALEFHLYYMSFQGAIVLAKHKLKEVPGMKPSSERVSVWTALSSLVNPEHVMLQQLHPLDHIEDLQSQMTCWKVLLSHVAGFASINAFGTLQQMETFSKSWQMSVWIVGLAALSLLLLQWHFDAQRRKVADNWKTFSSLYDDRMEELYHECYIMWHEEAEEPEDNVLALTLSFLTVQTVRFWISGHMPDVEGLDGWAVQTTRSISDIETLLMAGALFCASTVALDLYAGLHVGQDADEEEPRVYQVALASSNQAFAWCMYFGCKWLVATELFVDGPEEKMVLHLILAALVTFIAVVAIWVLDKLADLEATGEDLDHAIIQVIGGNSILVGFAWEQCFDRAIEVIAAQGTFFRVPPLAVKLALAAACICVIIPAWRRWILPMVLREGWKFGFVIDGSDAKWGKVFKSKRWHWLMHRIGIQVIGFKKPSMLSKQKRDKNHGMAFQKRRKERGMFKILQKEKVLSISDGWPDSSPEKENGLKFVNSGGAGLQQPLLQDSELCNLDRSVSILHRQILHFAEAEASKTQLGPEMAQLSERQPGLRELLKLGGSYSLTHLLR